MFKRTLSCLMDIIKMRKLTNSASMTKDGTIHVILVNFYQWCNQDYWKS